LQIPSLEQNKIISLKVSAGWRVTLYSKEYIFYLLAFIDTKAGYLGKNRRYCSNIISSAQINSMVRRTAQMSEVIAKPMEYFIFRPEDFQDKKQRGDKCRDRWNSLPQDNEDVPRAWFDTGITGCRMPRSDVLIR